MYTKEELHDLQTKRMIIYKIENLVNGKVYIGQTIKTFNERYSGSGVGVARVINDCRCHNEHLTNSIKKYGVKNFKVSIICECEDTNELNEKEIYYINLFDATNYEKGYNFCRGGKNGGQQRRSEKSMYNSAINKMGKSQQVVLGMNKTIKKFGKIGISKHDILIDFIKTKIIVVYNSGEFKTYQGLACFINQNRLKSKIFDIYTIYVKCNSNLNIQDISIKGDFDFEIFDLSNEENIPTHILSQLKDRDMKLKIQKENIQEKKCVFNLLRDYVVECGEYTEYEIEDEYDYFKNKPKIKATYTITDEQARTIVNNFVKVVKEKYPNYYKKHITIYIENGEIDYDFFWFYHWKRLKF